MYIYIYIYIYTYIYMYISTQIRSEQFAHTLANLGSCTSLKYSSVWHFLDSPYILNVYFAESNNTLTIRCSLKWI